MDNVSTIYRGDPILIIVTSDATVGGCVVGEEISYNDRGRSGTGYFICQRPTKQPHFSLNWTRIEIYLSQL